MIYNEICFTCNYSTANSSCKCGLNHNSKRLFEMIEKKDKTIKDLLEVVKSIKIQTMPPCTDYTLTKVNEILLSES